MKNEEKTERLNFRVTRQTTLLLDIFSLYYGISRTKVMELLLKDKMEEVQGNIVASLTK